MLERELFSYFYCGKMANISVFLKEIIIELLFVSNENVFPKAKQFLLLEMFWY
jgi:hypothetical protein